MVAGMFFEARRSTVHQGRELQPVAEVHRLIYQAIRARDRALAGDRMVEHLLEAERLQEREGAMLSAGGQAAMPSPGDDGATAVAPATTSHV